MKTTKILMAALLLAGCTASCSKDDDGGGSTYDDVENAPEHALRREVGYRYIEVLDENGATVGTYPTLTRLNSGDGDIATYKYNSKGQLARYKIWYYDLKDMRVVFNSIIPEYLFEYDGDALKSFVATYAFFFDPANMDNNIMDTITYTCHYENGAITSIGNGHKSDSYEETSSLLSNIVDSAYYHYSGDGKITSVDLYAGRYYTTVEIGWDGNNVKSYKSHSNVEYKHDSQINPHYGLLPDAVAFMVGGYYGATVGWISQNNIYESGESRQCEYDMNGFPTEWNDRSELKKWDYLSFAFHYHQMHFYSYEGGDMMDESKFKKVSFGVNNEDFGHIGPNDPGCEPYEYYVYPIGFDVVFMATATEGHRFVQWDDGNTDNPRTATVTDDASFTAIFE